MAVDITEYCTSSCKCSSEGNGDPSEKLVGPYSMFTLSRILKNI